ncbi:hypothetical protein NK718_16215 [Alsobacter sp. SYSU M60028]|uniref:Uncharacterized protein n=1 Tax=Alsobacter ponti TaxID=2962936 RepID=A0ABT1LF02_9HYPH|nr:hypothetical protein [Alsobacter ponti]MCP8940072.1 hypothetical protein [Alsobacter ponti]
MDPMLNNAIRLGLFSVEAGIAAGVTIAARAPLLMGVGRGSPRAAEETRRMVSEKAEAAIEGAIAAQFAMGRFWMRIMLGQVSHPAGFADGLAGVAAAAARPAHRRVRANAKRLAGGVRY